MGKSLQEWQGLTAYYLSGDADCASPDSLESEGAEFLARVRDGAVELLKRADDWHPDTINDDGSVHEIADGAPSVYTHTLWKQFVDLAAYTEEPESGEWPDDLNQVAGVALYQIAERLVWAIINDVHEWREEQDDDDPGDDDPEPDPATDPADVESLPDDVRPDWH